MSGQNVDWYPTPYFNYHEHVESLSSQLLALNQAIKLCTTKECKQHYLAKIEIINNRLDELRSMEGA